MGVVVDDLQSGEGQRPAGGTERARAVDRGEPLAGAHHRDRYRLGLAVDLVERIAEDVVGEVGSVVGDRCPADVEDLEGAPVPPSGARVPGQVGQHGRRGEHVGDALALHEVEALPGIEVVHHHVGAAGHPDGHEEVARGMGDGPDVQAAVTGLDRRPGIEPVPAGGQPGVDAPTR